MNQNSHGDIDLDLGDRTILLQHIDVTAAAMHKDRKIKKHNTGVHPTVVPYDPVNDVCALDYRKAQDRGYMKIDLLNVWVYKLIRDEKHLIDLMREPNWSLLQHRETVEKLIHIGRHYNAMISLCEPINSIARMAMFLALIRPAKKHLLDKSWSEIAATVWEKNVDDTGYAFRKSHAIAYAQLVVIHLNLLEENPMACVLPA